jgi:Uma2 family endonuclease
MITSIDQLDLSKKYSYADYLTWRFDEYVELLRGKISRMAAPSRAHQKAVGKFNYLLQGYLDDKRCEVYVAPFDVRLLDHKKSTADKDVFTVVQPDVCVICDTTKLDDKGCLGSPDLIIEVLSPGTQKKDYDDKFELYAFNGVTEYWIVAPNDDLVSVYDLDDNNAYQFRKTYIRSEVIPSKVLVDFKCDLERVFSAKN